MGDDIGGIAVHIAARVAALAGAGEVLTSSTVRDLVAGSGLVFEDRGEQMLKGVPDPWRSSRLPAREDEPGGHDQDQCAEGLTRPGPLAVWTVVAEQSDE